MSLSVFKNKLRKILIHTVAYTNCFVHMIDEYWIHENEETKNAPFSNKTNTHKLYVSFPVQAKLTRTKEKWEKFN